MQTKFLLLFGLLFSGPTHSFSFIVFGDFNGGGCDRNDRVARIIEKMSQEEGIDFYLSTGDLIDGFANGDGQITSCFATDPATVNGLGCEPGVDNGNMRALLAPLMSKPPAAGLQFSFYPVIGNHDDNWGSGWYPSPCNDGICDLLHIAGEDDADMIARFINDHEPGDVCSLDANQSSHSNSFYYAFAHQNAYFIVLRQNNDSFGMLSCNNLPSSHSSCADYCTDPALFDDFLRNDRCYSVEQYDWLRGQLTHANDNNYEHIFVFGHAPLLGSGENHGATHGADQIRALLESQHVDIYFNGHNHAYERTAQVRNNALDDSGTAYITVGVAGALTDTNLTDWFTAATYRLWTSNYADTEKMATYLIVTVEDGNVSGQVKSLGVNQPTDVVDAFDYSATAGEDLIYLNGFETSLVPVIAGCEILPQDNLWNTPIDSHPVHPNNSNYLNSLGLSTPLHADFGTTWQGVDIGIPYNIIETDQSLTPIELLYWDESDLGDPSCNTSGQNNIGCYPIPVNPNIEGGSDDHILMLQKQTCLLYELFNAEQDGSGQWTGGSGAIWDLSLNQQRPLDWTSADASGLAILPGLIRYDEVHTEGEIKHAIRFTHNDIQAGYILPATHSDGGGGQDPNKPPMGLRLRLKSSVDIDGFDPTVQVILRAMKKYGIVLTDTGGSMFISGEHHDLWNDGILAQLGQLSAGDFEAVYTGDVIPYPSTRGAEQ